MAGPQSGILNRPPEHLIVAALSFAGDRDPTRRKRSTPSVESATASLEATSTT